MVVQEGRVFELLALRSENSMLYRRIPGASKTVYYSSLATSLLM